MDSTMRGCVIGCEAPRCAAVYLLEGIPKALGVDAETQQTSLTRACLQMLERFGRKKTRKNSTKKAVIFCVQL
jgi:hypothetical protein